MIPARRANSFWLMFNRLSRAQTAWGPSLAVNKGRLPDMSAILPERAAGRGHAGCGIVDERGQVGAHDQAGKDAQLAQPQLLLLLGQPPLATVHVSPLPAFSCV